MRKLSSLHVRRCHCCGAMTQACDDLVSHCQSCGKYLAPFYYFDEAKVLGKLKEKDVDIMYEHYRIAALPCADYPALRGMTVVWNVWNEEGDSSGVEGRQS